MLDAYLGTIDYEGESIDEALSEVRSTLDGSKGPFDWSASRVIEREGMHAAACLVIRWREQPLVAFSMTRARFKNTGLARTCLISSMNQLAQRGEATLALFVTLANKSAVSLYQSLGFAIVPSDA
jgi:ribosomal protein S18 acetylase RimI-like enzyme